MTRCRRLFQGATLLTIYFLFEIWYNYTNLIQEKKMTIQQKIKQAKNVFVWVLVYDGDGEYIQTSKANVVRGIHSFEMLDKNKFVLREDGDLYIN